MASRGGQRAAGTDGTDFMHRERVASHYSISALNKGRIKWTILCHWLVFVLMLLRLSADFCRLAKVSTPMFIAQLHLPPPRVWEVMWLPSIMASMFAQLSLKKNNSSLLKQALLGCLLLGAMPVSFGLYEQYPVLRALFTDSAVAHSNGFPFDIFSSCWLAITIQVHVFQLYFAQQLLSSWSSVKTKKS